MDDPAVSQLPQNGPSVSQPSSGTYGEAAANQRLKAALPGPPANRPDVGNPAKMTAPPKVSPNPITAAPPGLPGRPSGSPLPDGVPGVILQGPSFAGAPNPVPNPVSGASTAAQGRIMLLQALAGDTSVSEQSRQWAQTVLRQLLG